jgi:peptide/nickel transport system substrate-binding protein
MRQERRGLNLGRVAALLVGILVLALSSTATPGPVPELKTVIFSSPIFIADGWGPPQVSSFQDLRIAYHLYDSLTAFDLKALAAGRPAAVVPSLAESWKVDPSGTVYTFKIREGVRFTTGRPVTAEAVKKSFERARKVVELAKITARYPIFRKMTSIEAVDARTLRITLDEPYAPFLATLAAPNYGIVDVEEALKHAQGDDQGQAWLKSHSAGTGPYILDEYVPEQRIVLRRNLNYWGGWDGVKPKVVRIIQLNIPEAATRQLQISRGEADIAHGLDAAQIKTLEANPDIRVTKSRIATTVNFLADLRVEPLRDVRVRQALRYAIDYEGMKNVVAGGYGEVLQTNFMPGMLGYEPSTGTFYKYDPAKAKQLLAEAGFPQGFEIQLVSRDGVVGTVVLAKAVTFYQQNLADIGVRARILEMTGGAMWGRIIERKLGGIGVSGAGATVFDPDNPATIRAVQESELLGWADADPEAYKRAVTLATQGARELDPGKRAKIYAELSRLMVERGPYWTFIQVVEPVVHRKNISGIVFSPGAFPIDWKYIDKQ